MMGQVAGMIREIRTVGEMLDMMVSSVSDGIRTLGRYLSRTLTGCGKTPICAARRGIALILRHPALQRETPHS
jgi:hypothetical protein